MHKIIFVLFGIRSGNDLFLLLGFSQLLPPHSLLDELKDADKTIGDANKDIQQNAAKIGAVKG